MFRILCDTLGLWGYAPNLYTEVLQSLLKRRQRKLKHWELISYSRMSSVRISKPTTFQIRSAVQIYYTASLGKLNIAAVCVTARVFALRPMKSENALPGTGKYRWYYV